MKPKAEAAANANKSENVTDISSSPAAENTIMLFKTPTCPNCKIAGSLLDEAGVHYEIMDAMENPGLVEKFGIKQAPTLVISSGNSYEKLLGVSDIRSWISSGKVFKAGA